MTKKSPPSTAKNENNRSITVFAVSGIWYYSINSIKWCTWSVVVQKISCTIFGRTFSFRYEKG